MIHDFFIPLGNKQSSEDAHALRKTWSGLAETTKLESNRVELPTETSLVALELAD